MTIAVTTAMKLDAVRTSYLSSFLFIVLLLFMHLAAISGTGIHDKGARGIRNT